MPRTEKTALVLSAGGLYCAWQAGAWKAIAGVDPPDLVVGASAGALNGWPIAGGCAPDLLIERWLDPGTSDVLRLIPKYGWRNGYFDPEPLRIQTEKMVAEFQPRIPFGVALVAMPRLQTILVQHPRVTAKHLLASCAIPLVIPSVAIDGVRYVDGALIDKVPVRGALEMGATRMIVLDCMPALDIWWLRLGAGALKVLRARPRLPAGMESIVIQPREPLGDMRSGLLWKRENIERWIDLGFRDATRALRTSNGQCL
jgi:NTE family protein